MTRRETAVVCRQRLGRDPARNTRTILNAETVSRQVHRVGVLGVLAR